MGFSNTMLGLVLCSDFRLKALNMGVGFSFFNVLAADFRMGFGFLQKTHINLLLSNHEFSFALTMMYNAWRRCSVLQNPKYYTSQLFGATISSSLRVNASDFT